MSQQCFTSHSTRDRSVRTRRPVTQDESIALVLTRSAQGTTNDLSAWGISSNGPNVSSSPRSAVNNILTALYGVGRGHPECPKQCKLYVVGTLPRTPLWKLALPRPAAGGERAAHPQTLTPLSAFRPFTFP